MAQQRLIASLKREFETRSKRNPAYSQRSFARSLNTSSGMLSEIMAGKRKISNKFASHLLTRIEVPKEDSQIIKNWLSQGNEKNLSLRFLGAKKKKTSHYQLSKDTLEIIAKFHHYSILNLLETQDFIYDSKWISQRLGLSKNLVDQSIKRLLRVGLVELNGNTLVATRTNLMTSQDISSATIRQIHADKLDLSKEALQKVSLEERDFSSISMAADPTKLPQIKALIRDFRRRVAEILEDGPKKEVLLLNIQLFPISKREETTF